MKIILASASPRRKELLEQIGVQFEIQPAKGEEVITKSIPEEVVKELSAQKAREVAAEQNRSADTPVTQEQKQNSQGEDILVIGADTIVANGDRIMGKPKDEEDAFRMLSSLQGKKHEVYTGVTLCLYQNGEVRELTFAEKTEVFMYSMTEQEIRNYIKTKEPLDKAGAYGIQGKCAAFIEKINGDYNNVVGLPVAKIYQKLSQLGIDILNIS